MRTHKKAQRLFPKTKKKNPDKIAISTQFPQPTVMEIDSMTIPSAASYEIPRQNDNNSALTSS